MPTKPLQVVPNNEIDLYNYVTMSNLMVQSTLNLSLYAQRLFYCAVSCIRMTDEEFEEIRFSVEELKDRLDLKNKNIYEKIENAVKELHDTDIYVSNNETQSSKKEWVAIHLMAYVKYCRGTVILRFNPYLKNYLLNLTSLFNSVHLTYLLKMNTPSAMRMLNYLFMHYNMKHRYMKEKDAKVKVTVPISDFSDLFLANLKYNIQKTGKSGSHFPDFGYINEKQLKPSLRRINKSRIMDVKAEYKRENAKNPLRISHVEFTISLADEYYEIEKKLKEDKKKKETENEIKQIYAYFYKRFNINKTLIKSLMDNGVSLLELKLAAIAMQSRLNAKSYGMWNKDMWKLENINFAIRQPYALLNKILEGKKYIKWIKENVDLADYELLKRQGYDLEDFLTITHYDDDFDIEKNKNNEEFIQDVKDAFEDALKSLNNVPNSNWIGMY